MAPKYKLYYFNFRGSAEPIRLIFALADVPYEDIRVARDDWPKLKSEMPHGTLPVLEIDGEKIGQSNAIARYLAKKYNLAGKNELESLQCDSIVDAIGDFKNFLGKLMREQDPVKKSEIVNEIKTEKIPFYLNLFNKIIDKNNGVTVGSGITWSDLALVVIAENLEKPFEVDLGKTYPAVKALKDRVYSLPKIAAWIKKRPETEF